jgi:hypothetical protein
VVADGEVSVVDDGEGDEDDVKRRTVNSWVWFT